MARDGVQEEKVFLNPFRIPGWVWKLNWERQIHRRKAQSILNFYMNVEPSQENEPWGVTRAESFNIFQTKEQYICEEFITEGLRLGVVNGGKVIRKIRWVYQSLPVWISWPWTPHPWKIRPPDTGKLASTWSFRICFKEEEWEKSDTFPALLFSQIPSV